MNKLFTALFCFYFIFTNCATTDAQGAPGVPPVPLRYIVFPESPRPGDPVTIGATINLRQAALFAGGSRLTGAPFVSIPAQGNNPGFFVAMFTVPATAAPGPAIVRLGNGNIQLVNVPITIAPREFRSETINLTPSLSGILTDPDPRRPEQAARLWAIITATNSHYYHTGSFILPVNSTRRTSLFGTRRNFRYPNGTVTTSIHEGIDFGVPTGTRVAACGSGRVVLAEDRIVTGNSIVIEHGPGIYSLYYHLDHIEVREGDMVRMGDFIGFVGSTGFSTGPHLHWELRISTQLTDPDYFISAAILDKDFILGQIFN